MNKEEMRLKIKKIRDNMNAKLVYTHSLTIQKKLINILEKLKMDNIFIYKSFKNEVNTNYIIKYLLNNNKKVFLPRIDTDDLLTIPYNKNTEMHISKFGILEPIGEPITLNDFICILPLIAIDKNGNRVGFGKGYYDRFLKNKNCLKIALCYDYQILENIIPTPLDVPVDIIISEKRIIQISHDNKKKRE